MSDWHEMILIRWPSGSQMVWGSMVRGKGHVNELTEADARRLLSASREGNLADALREVLSGYHCGGRLTAKQAAELANMSLRSFQRKLASSGVVYSELVDETRSELAVEMLKDEESSLAEIAKTLGYSTSSNFARAFERWTGTTPALYRGRM